MRTAAWPLALAYAVLIVYASLYPFGEWRDQGIAPWSFVTAPLPRWWTGFDVASNVLGYAPLGFLLSLAALRWGRGVRGMLAMTGLAVLLSFLMEALQSYLPARVPSNVDFVLNAGGAVAGMLVAWALERLGALERWSQLRERWFIPDASGALVLLALWPVALLFPVPVPFGLGQVLERLEDGLAELLEDTPFLEWLPLRDVELQPLVPGIELLCVVLGLLSPCLLAYSVVRARHQRAVCAALVFGVGTAVTVLSSVLSYSPSHAWEWITLPVQVAYAAAAVLAGAALFAPRRACAGLALLVLVLHLNLLNQAPNSAYFWQTLQTWEQGRFIRFHGVAQWVGWLWPFAAVGYVLLRISRRERPGESHSMLPPG